MPGKSILNHDERKSSAWNTIKAHINERLARLDIENRKDNTDRETCKIRGAIYELEQLLKAVEPSEIEFNEEKVDHYQ